VRASTRQTLATALPALVALACVLIGAWVLGQLANKAQSGGQVNPQVNPSLYGGTTNSSVRYNSSYGTSRAMDSEYRYASWTSGALPSDIRMNYAKLGPLHPDGPLAYVPPATPSYLPQPKTTPPAAMGGSAYSGASIRYSTPAAAPSSSYIAPVSMAPAPVSRAVVSPALVSSGTVNRGAINSGPMTGPINSGPINTGSIRYGP
jgi:hypothetical protein